MYEIGIMQRYKDISSQSLLVGGTLLSAEQLDYSESFVPSSIRTVNESPCSFVNESQ